eukprot:scaffold965_cov120-Isochrysis_galbana.AAC.7
MVPLEPVAPPAASGEAAGTPTARASFSKMLLTDPAMGVTSVPLSCTRRKSWSSASITIFVREAGLSRCISAARRKEVEVDHSSSTHPRRRIESACSPWCVRGQQTSIGPRSAQDISFERAPLVLVRLNISAVTKRNANMRQSSPAAHAAAARRRVGGNRWSARAELHLAVGGGDHFQTSKARLKLGSHSVERSQHRRSSSVAAAVESSLAPHEPRSILWTSAQLHLPECLTPSCIGMPCASSEYMGRSEARHNRRHRSCCSSVRCTKVHISRACAVVTSSLSGWSSCRDAERATTRSLAPCARSLSVSNAQNGVEGWGPLDGIPSQCLSMLCCTYSHRASTGLLTVSMYRGGGVPAGCDPVHAQGNEHAWGKSTKSGNKSSITPPA